MFGGPSLNVFVHLLLGANTQKQKVVNESSLSIQSVIRLMAVKGV